MDEIFTRYMQDTDRPVAKMIGLLCPYTVEEIIDAAGLIPVRLIPREPNIRHADAYIPSTLCSYLRYVVDMAAAGEIRGLRGIVINHSCDGARRILDIFQHYMPEIRAFFLDIPKRNDEYAVDYFAKEIGKMKQYMEELSGTTITEDMIKKSIAVYNKNRELLQKLYETRVMDADVLIRLLDINASLPKSTANRMIQELLDNLRPDEVREGKRVFVSGNIYDALPLLRNIEEDGGVVVGDDFCFGGRYFPGMVEEKGDVFESLARRYLDRVPCGRMVNFEERIEHILEEVKRTNAAGVVYASLKFCDNFLVDFPLFRDKLEQLKIPVLFLESEYFSLGSGQVRTRVEAFLERL